MDKANVKENWSHSQASFIDVVESPTNRDFRKVSLCCIAVMAFFEPPIKNHQIPNSKIHKNKFFKFKQVS